ncbi:MAG: methylenetetrahydrofolate reductase C-terminal domain-containing protein [Candidatus Aerophobetes bacterium]|nr:methylenetetrahydrofolate reductase C-terminal domain-containing protein [Candidatus Aerophobetes bacterium]
MLITQIKPEEEILPKISLKKLFILECPGCEEVYSPAEDVERFINRLKEEIIGRVSLDYLCNREFVKEYLRCYSKEIERAEAVLVFSCGVGVQIISSLLEDKPVYTACDTLYLNGFQGLSVQDFNCDQCGECYLNYTGGICPITNCPKGLLNGPCGGAKDGKCEVDPEADCVWILIYKRLKKSGKLDILKKILSPRNYQRIITESLSREEVKR